MGGPVLVMGATGRQGGAVVDALLRLGREPVAFVRDPETPPARRLAGRGVPLAVGSYEEPETVTRALAGVAAVFTMTSPRGGPAAEVERGRRVLEAVAAAGVSHVVHASVANADRATGVAHFDAKRVVERHLEGLGIPATIVAPASLMENLLRPAVLADLRRGRFRRALPPDRKLAMVAAADLGGFAALAFDRPEAFAGRRIDIAGDELSGREAARVLSAELGHPVTYQQIAFAEAGAGDLPTMHRWFDRVGFRIDIAGLRRDHPEVGWTTFREWAGAQDW